MFVDDAVRFQAKLLGPGFQGEKVTVRLKELEPGSSDPKAVRELESKEVEAPADGQPKRVELVHRPKTTGERTFILEVDNRPRELQTDNNRIERVVTVRKEKLRVLYVDSEPRYEFRYLKNYLERDETIDLNVVLLSSDPEYSEQDRSALPTFPAAKDDLFAYDVVVFGDADTSFLEPVADAEPGRVRHREGGRRPVHRRRVCSTRCRIAASPLELLLPIELSDAQPHGRRHERRIRFARADARRAAPARSSASATTKRRACRSGRACPSCSGTSKPPERNPAALVLAEHPTATGSDGKLPLVLYQFVGAGKSMFHAFDDTWRWRFRAGDKYFGRFWVQTIRFLARSRLVGQRQAEVQTDRRRYQRGQPIQFRVRFPNPGLAPTSGDVAIQVEKAGQGPRKLALKLVPGTRNVFEGALPQAAEGDYEVRLLPPPALEGPIPTASFRVEAPGQRV